MKNKSLKICICFLIILLYTGCNNELFETTNKDFEANSFISSIKSFDLTASYKNDLLPIDTLSDNKPYVTVQSCVVKGKDILMSITVPDDTEELYLGASNSSAEYMGLRFWQENKPIPSGYFQLNLNNLKSTKIETNGFKTYQVVLSSVEDIQVDEFDLAVSYKTASGISNCSSTSLNVKSIAPYQEILKVGFQPLTGYTYSIEITTPSGNSVKYSFNKDSGSEVFNNSQVADANLTFDSNLGFNWIDFSNPEFGGYSMTAKIEIDISGASQYIYVYLAIIAEGKIEQIDLNADIQQTGQNSAIGKVYLDFNYFSEFKYTIVMDPIISRGYYRIPVNDPYTINIQIHPDDLQANEHVLLELVPDQLSSGAVVFIENGVEKKSIEIQKSQEIVIKGKKNSIFKDDILLKASYKGNVLAEQRFSVRTWPTNFNQVGNAKIISSTSSNPDPLGGFMQFKYEWESESGVLKDLYGIRIGEMVEYPEGVHEWPSPPYRSLFGIQYPVENPTTIYYTIGIDKQNNNIIWSGFGDTHHIPTTNNDNLNDKNLDIAFKQPYQENVIISTQFYIFHDPIIMLTYGFNILSGPHYIRRNIYEDPPNSGVWKYRIEKNGAVAERILP